MVYLGIDYGLRKIGLAISEGITASPLKIIEVSGLEDALEKIRRVIAQEKVDTLVVGVPETGTARDIVKKFISKICKYATVIEFEETLTSIDARKTMITLGKGRKLRAKEDAYAATIILQNYLDEKEE